MPDVYAIGSTNDRLVGQLSHPDPALRADAIRTISSLHVYLALPRLVEVARADSVPGVRDAARAALGAMMDSPAAAERALAGRSPDRWEDRDTDTVNVIALFNRYVAARTNRDYSKPVPGPREEEVRAAAFGYLANWIGAEPAEQSELRTAAESAIGTIARFCEIPPQQAGLKVSAYRDARSRVAEYETARTAATA